MESCESKLAAACSVATGDETSPRLFASDGATSDGAASDGAACEGAASDEAASDGDTW